MSYNITAYKIRYDNNFGSTDTETIYCKYNNTNDTQLWIDENCNPITISGTDSRIKILALCMLQQKSDSKIYYWDEPDDLIFPDNIIEYFKNH